MKAVVKICPEKNGLALQELPIRHPQEGEVLVRIAAASICGSDLHIYAWNQWAKNLYEDILPMPMGHEFCGTVEEVGDGVRSVRIGDRVCAETHIPCGHCDKCRRGMGHICDNLQLFSRTKAGCFSEYTTVPEKCLIHVPDSLSDIEGALMEPFGVSVRAVSDAEVAGKFVLIQGCGPLGLMAVMTARAMGAAKVLATDIDPYRLRFAKSVGADEVIDPADGDVPEQVRALTGGVGVRAICEITGSIPAIQTGFRCMAKGGRYIFTGMPSQKLEIDVARDLINREVTLQGCYGRKIYETWNLAFDLLEAKRIDLSKIATHKYPLADYAQAFQTAVGRKCGKVLLINQ